MQVTNYKTFNQLRYESWQGNKSYSQRFYSFHDACERYNYNDIPLWVSETLANNKTYQHNVVYSYFYVPLTNQG